MPDPVMRAIDTSPLFGTQYAASLVAGKGTTERYARILDLLRRHGELSLPDLCELLGVTPNQISGRLSELNRMAPPLIEPTGRVKKNPATGCSCTIWRLRDQS